MEQNSLFYTEIQMILQAFGHFLLKYLSNQIRREVQLIEFSLLNV